MTEPGTKHCYIACLSDDAPDTKSCLEDEAGPRDAPTTCGAYKHRQARVLYAQSHESRVQLSPEARAPGNTWNDLRKVIKQVEHHSGITERRIMSIGSAPAPLTPTQGTVSSLPVATSMAFYPA